MKRPDGVPGRGFSMIELLLLASIIGIMASIAYSGYMHFRKKAFAIEAPVGLNSIWKLEQEWREDHATYSGSLSLIGFTEKERTGKSRYAYDILGADAVSFTARARADLDGDAELDTWTITNSGALFHTETD